MNFVALRMLTGDQAKYFGLVFAIAFCTFLLENQTAIFANIMKRTGSQIFDVTDAEVWVMDPKTEYWEQTKALKDTDLTRVRGVPGVQWAVRLFKGNPVARTSLTGDSTERVDTRVLQVIYRVDHDHLPLFVGQQLDVFIDGASEHEAATG
jgi:hypothetical protein